jgi:hypothetical protein
MGDLRTGWSQVQSTLARIEQAYTRKDNTQLRDVLEADWADLIVKYMKPLDQLLPLKEAAGRAPTNAPSA